jgi:hypothetical protein
VVAETTSRFDWGVTMIELESMAVAMPEVAGHPNRAGFRGVLTVVDAASQRAPSGAKGHLVVLTKKAAEAALPSLLGMALDYAPAFDRHDVRRKVGVITRAEIVGRNLELGGHLFAKDFPEIVEEIAKSGRTPQVHAKLGRIMRDLGSAKAAQSKGIFGVADSSHTGLRAAGANGLTRSLEAVSHTILRLATTIQRVGQRPAKRQDETRSVSNIEAGGSSGLGMSYEVTDVEMDTSSRVWTLTKVTFTGAAILRRDKAAYQNTWIELE